MTYTPLTLDQLRNARFPENSPERIQQKAQEDKAVGTFVEAMKKFDYADSNAQKRELELEAAKVRDQTGVQVRYESSFWSQGSLIFPKEMIESSVRAALAKVTKGGEGLPINGNQEEGYSIAVSDLASAAPELVKEAQVQQQKEVTDLKTAKTDAANKVLEAHGWDLTGHNHRLHDYSPPADSLIKTAAVSPKSVTASAPTPPAPAPAENLAAATTHAIGERSPAISKPKSIGVNKTVVAHALPEKTQHLNHRAQLKTQNAKAIAEIRELVETTRLAALESASASQDTIRLLSVLRQGRTVLS
ncbi:hypothetical protein F6R98_12970 [Candidatus Methylospira mobilis]|uniref:Uncharacterized protein n=1 Tax=Candidatus Methylospira mobilis TaxID=1808979 RepID=A0A5Q0BHR2_9GAMM|nr:hypothetical protein [Candidatus Methylospira mobilis]QFY43415.1 hypothetical protein F6R98_12970 [Candidatus Methylospira mobilis]